MTEPPKKPPKLTPWRKSEAKKQLIKDIKNGTIEGWGPKEVHLFRPFYEERPYENFRNNLRNLRKSLKDLQSLADEDAAALAHDEALDHLRKNSNPYPLWHGSEAERLLKLDIDNGLHKQMHPSELKATRNEYKPWPRKVFGDHIQQELRARRERPYWMARRAEKEAEKAKKKKKKAKKKPPPQPVA